MLFYVYYSMHGPQAYLLHATLHLYTELFIYSWLFHGIYHYSI